MKIKVSNILNSFKPIGYLLLLISDVTMTILSSREASHSLPEWERWGISLFFAVIITLGVWVFLTSLREKGFVKWVKILVWLLSVILIVLVNWSFMRTIIETQTQQEIKNDAIEIKTDDIKDKQINQALDLIAIYVQKMAKLNQWQEKERDSITKSIDEQNKLIKELSTELKKTDTIQKTKTSLFSKMSVILNGNEQLTTALWWLLLFIVAQFFTVIAAPKSDNDIAQPSRKRERVKRDPTSWYELIKWWVWANWAGIRTKNHRKILKKETFDQFIPNHYRAYSNKQYDAILRAAIRSGVVDGEDILEIDEETARKKIEQSLTLGAI